MRYRDITIANNNVPYQDSLKKTVINQQVLNYPHILYHLVLNVWQKASNHPFYMILPSNPARGKKGSYTPFMLMLTNVFYHSFWSRISQEI